MKTTTKDVCVCLCVYTATSTDIPVVKIEPRQSFNAVETDSA